MQALLAYLAVESERPQPRETLASLLWGNTGEERARHNLRQALSKIRRQCGELVIADGDCLRLNSELCVADVREFERLAASGETRDLRRCVDLYRGELLEGLNPREPEYHEWLLVTRGRFRKEACQAAARLASRFTEQDRPEEAITALGDLLALDSAHEPAHQALMRQLDRVGRRTDALRQYQLCVEAMKRELGADPSAETKRLHEAILGRSAEQAVSPSRAGSSAPKGDDAAVPAVAVLPFENLSSAEDAYFVDGIAEDLITALSCFHSLVVIARGSTFAYRGREVSEQTIADELGAQYLVRGSVQRSADRVRINVQLLDAIAGLHVWGHRFDRELEDVFLLQDEITSTLVSTLAGRVEAARLAHARKAPPERLHAYDLLLRGKDHHHRYTPEDCRLCIEMFERAIQRDPAYAVAYAWLACGLGQAMVFRLDKFEKLVDRCQAAAEKGLALDPDESECHRLLAQVSLTRGNLKRALHHQERGLFLNPNDDRLVNAMGEMLVFAGRPAEAEQWVRKSMRLNPYHPSRYWTHLGRSLFHQGRYEESLEAFDGIDRLRVDDLSYCVAAASRLGRNDLASQAVARLREESPEYDPREFVASLPFESEEDRQALVEPLVAALER